MSLSFKPLRIKAWAALIGVATALVMLAFVLLRAPGYTAESALTHTPDVGRAWLDEARLPCEAQATLKLIRAGGPFPYPRDGSVFRNREGRLPARPPRYYTEYTVPTPGQKDRGARRIVAGQGVHVEYWYTDDHYETFHPIRVCTEHEPCAEFAANACRP